MSLRRRELSAAIAGAFLPAGCGVAPSHPGPPPGTETPPSPANAAPGTAPGVPASAPRDTPPPAPREFRAAWVATVAHIDWPSRSGLTPERQRAEALAIIERAREIGLNALVLQVRTAADALYPSALEPWSEWLSGEQGRASEPAYDPLAFWVQEAHRSGIELHAWFNPFRARHSSARSPLSAKHIARSQPGIVKRYGDQLWLDPGEAAAVAHTLAVVADVVKRYDIDGVHVDDYFYPYPVAQGNGGGDLPFPDEPSWKAYRDSGGTLAREDWRRENVNRFVQALQRTVRALKPQVRVGISPFGIGRPELRPAGIEGFSQFHRLYADVELWLANGWLDILAPQLYWPVEPAAQAFPVLLDYWHARNVQARHVWPALFTSSVAGGAKPWPAAELLQQVALVRQRAGTQGRAPGHLHFSMNPLMQDRGGLAARLKQGPYAQAALVPPTPWLDDSAPAAPGLRRIDAARVQLTPGAGKPVFVWALWRRHGASWRFATQPAAETIVELANDARLGPVELMFASAVDRLGNQGPAVVWRR